MTKFNAPAGASSVSLGGTEYPVVDGFLEAPGLYAEELKSHGYSLYNEPPPAPAPAPQTDADDNDGAGTFDLTTFDPATADKPTVRAFLSSRGVQAPPAMGVEKLRGLAADELPKAKADAAALAAANDTTKAGGSNDSLAGSASTQQAGSGQ